MADYPRRFSLRAATAKAHADLDALVGDFGTREAYGRYLTGLRAFRAPVEAALYGEPGFMPIAAAILEDMARLGVSPSQLAIFPAPDRPSARLGVLYVLAGSALGARVLLGRAEALDLPAAHLRAQTADRALWTSFCARLERADPYDPAEAAAAACQTFAFAHGAFAATPAAAFGTAHA